MLWESLRNWLFECGYILYHPDAFGRLPCPHPWAVSREDRHPTCYEHVSSTLSFAEHMTSSHAALDFDNRDVVIAMMHAITATAPVVVQPCEEASPGSLIEVFKLGQFVFHVILQDNAQWYGDYPRLTTPGQIFYVLCSTYESISFMHENGSSLSELSVDITARGSSGKFDVTSAPQEGAKVVLSTCGIPMRHNVAGHAIEQEGPKQLDQNSQFVDDVLWFGEILAFMFKAATPHIPMLAPLLDRLVSGDAARQLTAAQALDHIKQLIITLNPDGESFYLEDLDFDDEWWKLPFDISAEDASTFATICDRPPVYFPVINFMFPDMPPPAFLYDPVLHTLPVPATLEDWYNEKYPEQIWQGLRVWFVQYDYELYTYAPQDTQMLFPTQIPVQRASSDGDPYPFAIYQQDYSNGYTVHSPGRWLCPAIRGGCDDVMIKVVAADSQELRILRRLNSEPCLSHPLNVTIPVLDFLEYDERFIFVVMPKWGHHPGCGGFNAMSDVYSYVLSMLKSMAFLHEFNIAYRDFDSWNFVINLCPRPFENDYSRFRGSGLARYALIDFGISIMFDPETPKDERLLSIKYSRMGHPQYHPPDVTDEQYEDESNTYDPFSYDVASLGRLIYDEIQDVSVPMYSPLTPFLNRMVSPDIRTRFTATEALHAFEKIIRSQKSRGRRRILRR